ncbi:MAG: Hsp20/alpha crystallin family protein [Bacteroidota bacterium]|nr:Hsp20/alpha crystallin family protein [Bacteroidota bacterium]
MQNHHTQKHNKQNGNLHLHRRLHFSPAQELLHRLYPDLPDYNYADTVENKIDADWVPDVDISENSNSLNINIDLPGVEKEQISLKIENSVLVLQGERHSEFTGKTDRNYCCERKYGKFIRYIELPDTVDFGSVNSELKNGVLKITFTKKLTTKSKNIDIL